MTTVVTKNWEPLLYDHVSKRTRKDWEMDIRVGSSVGHGEEEWLVVGELEVLIGKLLAVDGLSAGSLVDD